MRRSRASMSTLGSSPLARGTQFQLFQVFERGGLIPARAGNTHAPVISRFHSWAHPRSRGEHRGAVWGDGFAGGSSPLARGTRGLYRPYRYGRGLIPARAGNTHHFIPPIRAFRAHPRSRGEHCAIRMTSTPRPGSSPLARGPPESRRCTVRGRGLIPARAGTTAVGAPA